MASLCKAPDSPSNGASCLVFSPPDGPRPPSHAPFFTVPSRPLLICRSAHLPHDGRSSQSRKTPTSSPEPAKFPSLRPLVNGSSYGSRDIDRSSKNGSKAGAPQSKPRIAEQVLPQHDQLSSLGKVIPKDAGKRPQVKLKSKQQRVWIDKKWKPSFVKALLARIDYTEESKCVVERQRSESDVGHKGPGTGRNRLIMCKQEKQIGDKDSLLCSTIKSNVAKNVWRSNLESCRLTGFKQETQIGDKDHPLSRTITSTVTKDLQNSSLESTSTVTKDHHLSCTITSTITKDLQNSSLESTSLRGFKQENQVDDKDHPVSSTIMNTGIEGSRSQSDEMSFYDLDVSKQVLLKDALCTLEQMDQLGVKPCPETYICLLQKCIYERALWAGMQVHAHMVKNKFKGSILIGNTLINMYLKCGSLVDARQVFRNMPMRNVYTWTLLITECAKMGYAEEAIKLYKQMEKEGVTPDRVTLLSVLKACASKEHFEQGKQVHAHVTEMGYESDIFVGSTLVDMYAKCKSLEDARQVFDNMPQRAVASWNAMIAGYAKISQGEKAFKLFQRLEWEGLKPTQVTFVNILNACASPEALEQGRWIHMYIMDSGLKPNVYLGNALVAMYSKCGSLDDARVVFNRMPGRNVVSWTAVITGYAQHGHGKEANKLFWQMLGQGLHPDKVALRSAIKAGCNLKALKEGKSSIPTT